MTRVVAMHVTETTRASLEELFAGTLLWADPVRRVTIPDVQELIVECAEVSLEALGLADETPSDPEWTKLLEFGRRCIKPWAEHIADRGIQSSLREPPFACLTLAERERLAARLRAVVDEKVSAAKLD
jgi:hypothetical protein